MDNSRLPYFKLGIVLYFDNILFSILKMSNSLHNDQPHHTADTGKRKRYDLVDSLADPLVDPLVDPLLVDPLVASLAVPLTNPSLANPSVNPINPTSHTSHATADPAVASSNDLIVNNGGCAPPEKATDKVEEAALPELVPETVQELVPVQEIVPQQQHGSLLTGAATASISSPVTATVINCFTGTPRRRGRNSCDDADNQEDGSPLFCSPPLSFER